MRSNDMIPWFTLLANKDFKRIYSNAREYAE